MYLIAANESNFDDSFYDINSKLNRLIYNQNLNKKLTKQFFANFGFEVNYEVTKDLQLKSFYESNNKYNNYFIK